VEDVDNKKLFTNAIKGMVSGLDPHSTYLEPKAQKSLLLLEITGVLRDSRKS
jgi:carboxyl-terminal processing protease